jgi:hypothetical protein
MVAGCQLPAGADPTTAISRSDHVMSLRGGTVIEIDGLKVFSATLARDREAIGDRVTEWIRTADVDVVDRIVTQSSDRAYHCLTITLFYQHRKPAARRLRFRGEDERWR